MKKLSRDEAKALVLKLFNENRLIAVLGKDSDIFYIYYYDNADVIELEIDTSSFVHYISYGIITFLQEALIQEMGIFYKSDNAIIFFNNINQKMIDMGYLELDIDESDLDDSDIINIKFIFPNSKCTVFINWPYLTNNIIGLFPLETIKKAITIKNKLKNDYLNILDTTFNFVDKRIENLSDEEKLYLKL